jgi:hypothetical protein
MAFTKAFYEQAFERNLKAQQQQKPETTSGFAAASSAMTRTQRATMQFTAYSKKEVVRVGSFFFVFFFVFVFLLNTKHPKCERRVEGKARGLGRDPGCAVRFYALV